MEELGCNSCVYSAFCYKFAEQGVFVKLFIVLVAICSVKILTYYKNLVKMEKWQQVLQEQFSKSSQWSKIQTNIWIIKITCVAFM